MNEDGGIVAALLKIVAVGIVIVLATSAVMTGIIRATADDRGRTDARELTVADGRYRISRYDEFFARCNAVVSVEGRIRDTQAALPGDDATQRFYDDQNLRALRGAHRDLVAQYNAAASATDTSARFRDSGLPDRLDPEGPNSCTV